MEEESDIEKIEKEEDIEDDGGPIYTKRQVVVFWTVFFISFYVGMLSIATAALLYDELDNSTLHTLYIIFDIVGVGSLVFSAIWMIVKMGKISEYRMHKGINKNAEKAEKSMTKSIDATLDYDYYFLKKNLEFAKFRPIKSNYYVKSLGSGGAKKQYIFYFSYAKTIDESLVEFIKVLGPSKKAFFSDCLKLYFIVFRADDETDIELSLKEGATLFNTFPKNPLVSKYMPVFKYLIYKESERKIYYNDLKADYATKKAVQFIENELRALVNGKKEV